MEDILRSKTLEGITAARRATGRTQTEFWSLLGITQSGGARYENGRSLPRPLQMLIWLRDAGRISDCDLSEALRATTPRKQNHAPATPHLSGTHNRMS